MSQHEPVYGIASWRAWVKNAPDNLKSTRQTSREVSTSDPYSVYSFDELFRIVSFLNVMNKTRILLFRGQSRDLPVRPTIFRDQWHVPHRSEIVDLSLDRTHYFNALTSLCDLVQKALKAKLPRHAPFDNYKKDSRLRVAPWSVIQHYELWPTPVIDLTSSLRVAASFALGLPEPLNEGFLYAYALPSVTSDLMELKGVPDPIAYRLSAVCPPYAPRPHLQEGILIGHSAIQSSDLDTVACDFLDNMLVAKFRLSDELTNGQSSFWSSEFPKFLPNALLPRRSNDELAERFSIILDYAVLDGKASWSESA